MTTPGIIEHVILEITDFCRPVWWCSILLESDHVSIFLLQLWHEKHLQHIEVWSATYCLLSEEKEAVYHVWVTPHQTLTLGLALFKFISDMGFSVPHMMIWAFILPLMLNVVSSVNSHLFKKIPTPVAHIWCLQTWFSCHPHAVTIACQTPNFLTTHAIDECCTTSCLVFTTFLFYPSPNRSNCIFIGDTR
jgi:hypothetical protein